MTTTPQTPTVGRRVWYWPTDDEARADMHWCSRDQPFDAGVVWVTPSGNAHLEITDHMGRKHFKRNVKVHNFEHREAAPGGGYATWMPYQQAQHAKSPTVVPRDMHGTGVGQTESPTAALHRQADALQSEGGAA